MSPMPNWSDFCRAYPHDLPEHSPYATSMKGDAMPFFMQPVDLIRRPSRSFISCSLMWFCSSPEPGTNYGMLKHDHVALNGTARGYTYVSRTRRPTAFRSHPTCIPGEPANRCPGSDEQTMGPFSPITCSLVAHAESVLAGKVVDPL